MQPKPNAEPKIAYSAISAGRRRSRAEFSSSNLKIKNRNKLLIYCYIREGEVPLR
jgi:hypothetical protein